MVSDVRGWVLSETRHVFDRMKKVNPPSLPVCARDRNLVDVVSVTHRHATPTLYVAHIATILTQAVWDAYANGICSAVKRARVANAAT